MLTRLSIILIFLISITESAKAQILIRGDVSDLKTGEFLPSANIWIKGTYKGTITNANGMFRLSVDSLPAVLMIRYIGYQSKQIPIKNPTDDVLHIQLMPSTLNMPEVVVTGEDPAIDIMRKVIEHKQKWWPDLKTYQADAYTRQIIENDTGIVSIMESVSTVYWNKKKGSREIVKARRQTANVNPLDNFAATGYVPNFYDDNIDIAGYKMVGVTNPRALDFYNFKLSGYRYQDNKLIYEIGVTPKKKLQPTFIGKIEVRDEDYALISVDLKPGPSFLFPPPIKQLNLSYRQQFNNFGKEFWLPVDMRINGKVKISMVGLDFPIIKLQQLSRVTNYTVNTALPDTLYKSDKSLYVSKDSLNTDSLFTHSELVVPLTPVEQEAYTGIDSTQTLERAFHPKGFLSRFVNDDDEKTNKKKGQSKIISFVSDHFDPQIWYNRVDAAHLGLTFNPPTFTKKVKLTLTGGYDTGSQRYFYGLGTQLKYKPWSTSVSYQATSVPIAWSANYTRGEASMLPLLGYRDYFDYYWRDAWKGQISYHIPWNNGKVSIGYYNGMESSIPKTTNYDLRGSKIPQRANPSISDGRMKSLFIETTFADDPDLSAHLISGSKSIDLMIEHSDKNFLTSDFSFTRYQAAIDWRFKTFFSRRLFPNTLDVKLMGGTYSGLLPVQRLGMIDGSLGGYTPFGAFKSIRDISIYGDQYAAFFWEHNFRTIPFELLGLHSLAQKGYSVIIFGSHGRGWMKSNEADKLKKSGIPYYNHWIHEVGLSVNGLFGFMRVDVAYRLDVPGIRAGVSLARIF